MKFLLLSSVILLASCSSTKLDPKKPIEINKSVMDDTYYQDGKWIDNDKVLDYLKSNEETKVIVQDHQTLILSGISLAPVSGFFFGRYLADHKGSDLLIGTIGLFAGFYLINMAEDKVNEGIQKHNESLSKKRVRFSPAISYDTLAGFLTFNF